MWWLLLGFKLVEGMFVRWSLPPRQVWRDLAKFHHYGIMCKKLLPFWKGSFNIWQKFQINFVNFMCSWANFHSCNWPKIEHLVTLSPRLVFKNVWNNLSNFSHSSHLKVNPEVPWVPLEGDLNALHSYDNSELVISGIYIRLFIANPGWVLRKPREFLTDLLEVVLRLMGQPNPNMEVLETVTTALVKLLEAQPTLSDMVPATGYLSR